MTPTLFQQWALFSKPDWVVPLVRTVGGLVGSVKRVRWAYECNETLDDSLRQFHGSKFIIPDIILCYEDDDGTAIVACEAKKPGVAVGCTDARKLESYMNLASLRGFKRRQGCFIVSELVAERSRNVTGGYFPVLSWERIRDLQVQALATLNLSAAAADRVALWISYNFACYGIGTANSLAPPSMGRDYGSEESFAAIDALLLPDSVGRFLKGSECAEAVRRGCIPAPPLTWLLSEPTREAIKARGREALGWQTTADRHLHRWSFDWHVAQERVWR